jgi:site-specific DNA-methyltransferase (adenine-specific)
MSLDLRNMDCMQLMKEYPDGYFDLAIVDPPYGIGIAKRNGSIGQKKGQGKITRYKSKDWDSKIPDKEYWDELFRVSKNQIVFGANYFTEHLPPSMGWIVYDKLQPEGVTFAMAELAYTSFNRSTKIFRTKRSNMQNCVSNNPGIGKGNAKIHPAQKPTEIYRWIFKNYAKEGDKILDTHLGSGSIALALEDVNGSEKMNLSLTASEIDLDHYQDMMKRIEAETAQQGLFNHSIICGEEKK